MFIALQAATSAGAASRFSAACAFLLLLYCTSLTARGADAPAVIEAAPPQDQPPAPDEDDDDYVPLIIYDDQGNPVDPCRQFDEDNKTWLDASRTGIYRTVCGTAARFDSFFGGARFDDRSGNTFGRFSLGGYWDERDKFDERLELRGSYALPALRDNVNVFVGRGEQSELLEERNGGGNIAAPVVNQPDDDTALFAGFGFGRNQNLERGFSFRLGLRFRTPVEPFVKARYNYAWRLTENNLVRARPVVYWIDGEGFGSTLTVDLDNYLGDAYLLRFSNFGNVTEDPEIEGVRWGSTLTLFQALPDKRGFAYNVFVRGETRDPVQLKNYGLQVTYRHRFLREWLFLEYVTGVSWPREFPQEERETNLGLGARFEIYFGPTPEGEMR